MPRGLCCAKRRDRAVGLLAVGLLLVGGAVAVFYGPAAHAGGEAAATGPVYPPGAAVTQFSGLAFDTCEAPPVSTMEAWRTSEYHAVGIYLSGANRGCRQTQLTTEWVNKVTEMGWRLLPIDLGLQAPCRDNVAKAAIKPNQARTQGATEADHAVAAAQKLGLRPGSAIYEDVESYHLGDAACAKAVGQYLSGWSNGLHRHGYLAGMYGNLNSAIADAAARYVDPEYTRLDAIWAGHWDGTTTMTGWRAVPDNRWSGHQRAKQYSGNHYEKHGDITLKVDADALDAPVATVASTVPVGPRKAVAHHAPDTNAGRAGTVSGGGLAKVVCRLRSADDQLWDELVAGSWVVDSDLAVPTATALPGCAYPQSVVAPAGAVLRIGPGFGHRAGGMLPLGALAWVSCRDAARPDWLRLPDLAWIAADNLGSGARATRALPICN